jgi:hypothetical protein
MKRSLFVSILLLIPLNSYAATQYHCDGRIQYRPCGQKLIVSKPERSLSTSTGRTLLNAQQSAVKASFKYQKEINNTADDLYADIVEAKYQRYANRKNYGQWRGMVKGNGDIYLTLLISEEGEQELVKSMGHVKLKNDQTSFNFISTPPQSSKWTWKILAVPK